MAEDPNENVEQPAADGQAPDAAEAAAEALADAQAAVDELQQEAGAEAETPDTAAALPADDADLAEVLDGPDVPDVDTGALADLCGIDMLGDVDLHVTIELGRTQMLVEDVLKLNEGSVVELDKLAGDPVDVFVNGCLIARGEVLVLNDNFCIRVSEIVENLEQHAEEAARAQLGAV